MKIKTLFLIIFFQLLYPGTSFADFNYRGTFVANKKTNEAQSYYVLLKENKNVTFKIKKISGDECKELIVKSVKLTSDDSVYKNDETNLGITSFHVPSTGIYEVSVSCISPLNKSISYDLNVIDDLQISNNISKDDSENLSIFIPEKDKKIKEITNQSNIEVYDFVNESRVSIGSAKITENTNVDNTNNVSSQSNKLEPKEENARIASETDFQRLEEEKLDLEATNQENLNQVLENNDFSELDPDAPAIEDEDENNEELKKDVSTTPLIYSGKLKISKNIDIYKLVNEKNKSWPQAICFDSDDNIWALDGQLCKIICFDPNGSEKISFGSKGNEKDQFGMPISLAVFKNYILVGDRQKCLIQVFDKKGNWLNSIKSDPNVGLKLYNPIAICIRNNEVWIADERTNRILCFDETLSFLGSFGSTEEVKIESISSLATDGDFLYVLQEDGELKKFGSMGNFISSISTHTNFSTDLFIDRNKNFWVTDIELGRAICYSKDGEILYSINRNSINEIISNISRFSPSSISINSNSKIAITDTYSKQILILEIQ